MNLGILEKKIMDHIETIINKQTKILN